MKHSHLSTVHRNTRAIFNLSIITFPGEQESLFFHFKMRCFPYYRQFYTVNTGSGGCLDCGPIVSVRWKLKLWPLSHCEENLLHKRVSLVNSEQLSAPPLNLLSEQTVLHLLAVNVPLEMLRVLPNCFTTLAFFLFYYLPPASIGCRGANVTPVNIFTSDTIKCLCKASRVSKLRQIHPGCLERPPLASFLLFFFTRFK